jgi:DNA repair protein RadA/Sms
MNCHSCGTKLPENRLRCPNIRCKVWNIAGSGWGNVEDSTTLLSDAKLGKVEYVRTNLVDLCFGGGHGIARTSVSLIGGDPGAGKTTLCMQLADIFAEKYNKEVLYIANEQDATELKTTAERLQLRHPNRIRVVNAMGGVTHDIGTLLLHYEPCATVLDSITKWAGEDMRLAVVICQRLKDYTVRLNAPTFVINQVTKDGDHAGLNKLQHAADTTMLFEVLGDTQEAPRRLHVEKNRFGAAPVSQYYEMTVRGLVELSEEEAFARLSENPENGENNA